MTDKKMSYSEEVLERSRKDSRLPASEFGNSPYDMFCVPPDVYEKYKDDVMRLSLSFQQWVAPEDGGVLLNKVNQMSDMEIAEKLNLDEDTVRKIRCMTEWDAPVEVWRNAAEFKRQRRFESPLGCTDRKIKNEPS
jgi:hypothetical protein